MGSLAHVPVHQRPLAKEVRECLNDGVMLSISEAGGMIAHVQVRSSLLWTWSQGCLGQPRVLTQYG